VLRIFNRAKRGGSFIYGLSSLGWVILFVSSLIAGFDLFGAAFSFQSIAYLIVAGLAGVLILFLNKPKKNPFVNLGAGLYSCYEMATGVVGDLISYVRLFAIGLAGTVIAQVFNELSKGLSGDIPVISFLIMVVILVIGHGLNIFISALGAFVHPVRLTFVEFYKNAEFEGGGRVFKPFKRKINNK
ncbi:MAG: V-type ATPase 116kDa subunit family protein, partial [Mucinivorans sp.]